MKLASYVAGLLGLAVLTAMFIRQGYPVLVQSLDRAGLPLLWLVPYRLFFFLLFAIGWRSLLRPIDPAARAGLPYLFWVTTVREAVDRLLPVASVGGAVVGVRLVGQRGLAAVPVAASVIVEVCLTLCCLYVFTATGLMLVAGRSEPGLALGHLLIGFAASLSVPIILVVLLRRGSAFSNISRFLRPVLGDTVRGLGADLDRALQVYGKYRGALWIAGILQLCAFFSGSFEVWFALRLFGHPVGIFTAIMLESLTQAIRHVAFIVPAGLGVQEAGLVLFGHALGIGEDLALAVSLAKRMREVLCGLPPLVSWQWMEGRRLKGALAGKGAAR